MTTTLRIAGLGIAAILLSACTGAGNRSAADAGAGPGRFNRSTDTLGTQRRMDVYGGATAPVLPTMGAIGSGK